MPSLADHQSGEFVKLGYIGDSGTAKTGSLTSLVCAGYKLRVLDMDNGLDSLKSFVTHECPANLVNVDYETRRDVIRSSKAGPFVGNPRAFNDAMDLMTKWSDGSDPSQWGSDTIFVLDSLSALGRAAYFHARGMNASAKDPRQWYSAAQAAIEDVIMMLMGAEFRTNVIVISHVRVTENEDGTSKGYMNAIGKALGPILPRYFNTLLLAESVGQGKNVARSIRTVPTARLDLKNPMPFKLEQTLPISTGMATIFNTLKGK